MIKLSPVVCGKKCVGGNDVAELFFHGNFLFFCMKDCLILGIPVKNPERMGFGLITPLFQGGKGTEIQSDFRNRTASRNMKITIF